MGKSWKTTVGGFLLSAGLAMQAAPKPSVQLAGIIIGSIGGLLLGGTAKDADVTGGRRRQ